VAQLKSLGAQAMQLLAERCALTVRREDWQLAKVQFDDLRALRRAGGEPRLHVLQ
jgi:hypothetical protein